MNGGVVAIERVIGWVAAEGSVSLMGSVGRSESDRHDAGLRCGVNHWKTGPDQVPLFFLCSAHLSGPAKNEKRGPAALFHTKIQKHNNQPNGYFAKGCSNGFWCCVVKGCPEHMKTLTGGIGNGIGDLLPLDTHAGKRDHGKRAGAVLVHEPHLTPCPTVGLWGKKMLGTQLTVWDTKGSNILLLLACCRPPQKTKTKKSDRWNRAQQTVAVN